MKKLVSLVLGGAMLFGAATLGLSSGAASARERHDRNYRHHRQHRRHHHRRHRRNHLSY